MDDHKRRDSMKGDQLKEQETEKVDDHIARILESHACRTLFNFGASTSERLSRACEELQEEQKQRWNFDFQTETPLPGRYQWVRTGSANGHTRNGSHEPQTKRLRSEMFERRSNSPRIASIPPCLQTEKMREDQERKEPARSRDTSLNRPNGSVCLHDQ